MYCTGIIIGLCLPQQATLQQSVDAQMLTMASSTASKTSSTFIHRRAASRSIEGMGQGGRVELLPSSW
jgi:hypothetical protein